MGMSEELGVALLGRMAERIAIPGALRQCAFARVNGPIFYSVAAASLLESTAPGFCERALKDFADHEEFCNWLLMTWLPERQARVARLREYIAVLWPEFDWASARERYAQMAEAYLRGASGLLMSRKALARCTSTAQSALFYRCLARWADDPQLREMAELMAEQDQKALAQFRTLFERTSKAQALGFRKEWREIHCAVRSARDLYVQSAFEVLLDEWGPNAPFTQITYPDYAKRVASAVGEHLSLRWPQRIFFKAWKERPRALVPTRAEPRVPGFKPVVPPGDRSKKVHSSPQWRP